MSQEKNQKFVEIIFLKNANMPNCCIDLRVTLCYVPSENDLYPIIPNSESIFISKIQYWLKETMLEGGMAFM